MRKCESKGVIVLIFFLTLFSSLASYCCKQSESVDNVNEANSLDITINNYGSATINVFEIINVENDTNIMVNNYGDMKLSKKEGISNKGEVENPPGDTGIVTMKNFKDLGMFIVGIYVNFSSFTEGIIKDLGNTKGDDSMRALLLRIRRFILHLILLPLQAISWLYNLIFRRKRAREDKEGK